MLLKVQKALFACLSLITHSTCQCCVEDGKLPRTLGKFLSYRHVSDHRFGLSLD